MASKIETLVDKRIALSNSSIARLLPFGSTWTKIRIGLRISMDDTGANITGTPRIYFGVLASPTSNLSNGPLGTTSNFWGAGTGNTSSYTRRAGPPVFYSPSVGGVRKVGATNTYTSSNEMAITTSATVHNAMIISLWKGTDGVADWGHVISGPSQNPTNPDDDITFDMLRAAMMTDFFNATHLTGMQSVNNTLSSFVNSGGGSYAVNSGTSNLNEGANGAFNALCFAWNQTSSLMHISDVVVMKQA